MNDLPQWHDYQSIFSKDIPLLDVRAPIEYLQGAFPQANNHPILNDQERELIGTCYKQKGREQAVALGHQLINGEVKQQRIQSWQDFIEKYPKGVLYCFRGGMRSKLAQQWIFEQTGIEYPRVVGGYKALRRFLIDGMAESITDLKPIILGGRTGSGKTLLLPKLTNAIDLEGLANHRGSAFGPMVSPQPSPIDFENALSIALLKHDQQRRCVLEDEGRNIGAIGLPKQLVEKMRQAPLVLLEVSDQDRLQITFQAYVLEMYADFLKRYGEAQALQYYSDYILTSVNKVKKRLGDTSHKTVVNLMQAALQDQKISGNQELHRAWCELLLFQYYDPMYDYQLSKKLDRVVFRGDKQSVLDYLSDQ